ncbi:MAG: hypothetical protein E2590_02695 [Chryseobacterium sp.]|nr:hypothetical protein [Chryseobacterium sp.]
MKKIMTLFVLVSSLSFSQVGIDTDQPKATLDVTSSPTDFNKTDGFIAPKLGGNELKAKDALYTSQLQGAIVYATSAANPPSTKTENVTREGYYYFDGSKWIRFSSGASNNENDINIYKDDGSLTNNRNVNLSGFNLAFTGNGNIGIGTTGAPAEKLELNGGDARFRQRVFIGGNTVKNAALGVLNTNASDLILRLTNTNNIRQFSVTDVGNVGIGLGEIEPSQRIDVWGSARLRVVEDGTVDDKILVIDDNGVVKKVSRTVNSDINIYKDNGTLTSNRVVAMDGKNLSFQGIGNIGIGTTGNPSEKLDVNGDSNIRGKMTVGPGTKNAALGVRNTDITEPIMRLTSTDNIRQFSVEDDGKVGIGLGTWETSEKLDVNGNVRLRSVPLETEIAATDRVMLLTSNGTGKKISMSTLRSEIDTNTNIYTSNGTLSENRTVTLGGNNLNFGGTGAIGIGVVFPTEKLDISGTVRLRNIPNGNTEGRILVVDDNGVVQKSSLPPTSSFVLYDTNNNVVSRNADDVERPLAFEGTPNKIYSDYIEKVDNTTYRVKKAGVYTAEVIVLYDDIPVVNSSDTRSGCRAKLSMGGKNLWKIGDRWSNSAGTTEISRSVILNPGAQISVETGCARTGNQTYKTNSGSTIFITYMPL